MSDQSSVISPGQECCWAQRHYCFRLLASPKTPACTCLGLQWAIYSMGTASHFSLLMDLPLPPLRTEDLRTRTLSSCHHPPLSQMRGQMQRLVQRATDVLKEVTVKMSHVRYARFLVSSNVTHQSTFTASPAELLWDNLSRMVSAISIHINKYDVGIICNYISLIFNL